MGLRDIAAADFLAIVENAGDFGWPIKVTNPAGDSVEMVGLSSDVSQAIDPETGQLVTGRIASVTLAVLTLATNGLGVPTAVPESTKRPWVILFHDVNGYPHTFKVSEVRQDRTIGGVVCILESYKPNFPESPWPPGS